MTKQETSCPFCSMSEKPELFLNRLVTWNEDWMILAVLHPQSRGHCILFPRVHQENLEQNQSLSMELFRIGLEAVEINCKRLEAPAYQLMVNNRVYTIEDTGNHVGHVHLHLRPRYHDNDDQFLSQKDPTNEYFQEVVGLLRRNWNEA